MRYFLKQCLLGSLVLFAFAMSSCSSSRESVNYKVAKNYFARNDAHATKTVIRSREDLEKLFGYATFMGRLGVPTAIDFSKQFAIAVIKDENRKCASIVPRSLVKDGDGTLLYTYEVEEREEQTYSVIPNLLIIVDLDDFGNVKFNELAKKKN